ncbi:GNAT family N-acetyltransferase [Paenibacillus aceris]|uniref:RimJ/RimL family protein N-acetyltransferase n=1 Tax=Paenibacillus aceris TaxID=869555 RepID=A0ABS4I9V1_9BACL|nr:GNAT family N-acetyltransferase [Paenibacillus aceris]MBP1967693.1 RimJ/RimL family protein N-acetyltransferase [Paenibacillus aceris]NHW38101.1 GNAT family N-acetyltransferase [Paenibacillus aceris]
MQPIFETRRLVLRPFKLADAKSVQELAGDIEVAKTTLAIPHPYPDGAAEAWIEGARQAAENGNSFAFAMLKKDDGTLIGNMSMGVTQKHERAELAYWVGRQYWGQGFATEAAQRMIQYGFEDLKLNRIFAAAMTKNPSSYKIMSKIGMKQEGIFKKHILKWDVFEDLVFYGMTKSDYDAKSH